MKNLPVTNIEEFECINVKNMLSNIWGCDVEQFLIIEYDDSKARHTIHRFLKNSNHTGEEGISIDYNYNTYNLDWEENYYRIIK